MGLGNQIHEFRKKHNLSQEQLAEKVGVARQTISKWELGETAPDIKQAQMLSKIFDVGLDKLLGTEPKEPAAIMHDCKEVANHVSKKRVAIIAVAFFLCAAIIGSFVAMNRIQILYPQGRTGLCTIQRKDPIRIGTGNADTIVFRENGKPAILCQIPDGFAPSE